MSSFQSREVVKFVTKIQKQLQRLDVALAIQLRNR
jgi:hypothetical protein